MRLLLKSINKILIIFKKAVVRWLGVIFLLERLKNDVILEKTVLESEY